MVFRLPFAIAAWAIFAPAITAPGTAPRATTPEPRPSFAEPGISPDGREIAFVSGGDIWTVAAEGGEARLLISHPATESRPLYSPDGKRLAFISNRTGNGDIYVLTFATGELTRITYDDVNDQLDAWSRDGRWLYFSSTSRDIAGMNDVYRVSVDGGTPMPVAADRYANEYWAAPSPDGSTVAITARGLPSAQWWRKGHSHIDESEIWLVHATGDTPRYDDVTAGGARSEWPMWSPDGDTLYFVSDRSGAPNLWARVGVSQAPRQLTQFTDGRLLWPTISNDGRRITFERDFGLWTYDVASGATQQLAITLRGVPAGASVQHMTFTNGIQQLALSPDGKKIAFTVHGEIFAASAKEGGDAARITATSTAEEGIDWAPDSRRIVYTSDRDGPWHLFMYDFGTRTETQLTRGTENDVTPRWSPDGTRIAFTHGAHELRVVVVGSTAAQGQPQTLATGIFDRPPYLSDRPLAWSPDSRWVAYLTTADQGKEFANVYVVSATGGESHPVSYLGNTNGRAISWSPDGTFILFNTGQRTEHGQIARVDLVPRTPRFREDQFRDLFNQETPRNSSPTRQQPAPRPATAIQPTDTVHDTTAVRRAANNAAATRHTAIVFPGIRQRLTLLPTGLDASSQAISPDGKYVLMTARAADQTSLYIFPIDPLSKDEPVARQLTSTPGVKSSAHWSPDSKEVYYLEGGRVYSTTVDSRATHPVAVTAEMDVDFAHEKMEVLAEAWTYLRDNFFRADMHGVNWNAVRSEYAARVAGSRTPDEMRRIMSLMVGELNASHSGVNGPPAQQPYTGRLGLRFDRLEYELHGKLRMTEVVPLGPAALAGLATGDYLLAVDDSPVTAHVNLDALLAYKTNRRTMLTVADANGGHRRDVPVRPVSNATEKGLLYRAWVEANRAYVAQSSGGRLGYVHMFDMGQGALDQLYLDLDAENQGREGVVIDVRNNNGGFVNAYALDVLSRRPYLTMQRRDGAATGARTQLGQRSLELPTVLVTNQHSLSDAEDFTEGYREMHLGKVVGEPTAGWIIYTSNIGLIDGSVVRLPSTRIRTASGADMELHPRPVDVEVTRPVGESYSGKDSQLDAAVHTLLTQIGQRRASITRSPAPGAW